MGLPVLKMDREDSTPGQVSASAELEPYGGPSEHDTEPMAAVAVRGSGRARRWAANLGAVDITMGVLVALIIGVDVFVALGGLRVTGNVNLKPGASVVTATHSSGTPIATQAPQATATPPPIPAGVIKFGGGGDTTATQQCTGTQPLPTLSYSLDNSHSTVAVDWWVDVQGSAPDGTTPWAFANRPYGTLPAGQTDGFILTPVATLCAELAGQPPTVYKATVSYGGVGAFAITDTIVAGPGANPTPTSTPPGGGPPGP